MKKILGIDTGTNCLQAILIQMGFCGTMMDETMEELSNFIKEQQKRDAALDLRLRNIEYMLEKILEQARKDK